MYVGNLPTDEVEMAERQLAAQTNTSTRYSNEWLQVLTAVNNAFSALLFGAQLLGVLMYLLV
jgi:hypothetical protein